MYTGRLGESQGKRPQWKANAVGKKNNSKDVQKHWVVRMSEKLLTVIVLCKSSQLILLHWESSTHH